MAAPTLTYQLTNGTTADASQVMQNFTDLLNGYTDGTKDLSISALTLAGNFTANGTTNTIGNASSDALVVTASLGSNLVPSADATYALGSSSIGFSGIYLGRNSNRVRIIPSSSASASYDFTLPPTAGASNQFMTTNGSGTLSWVYRNNQTSAKSANYTVTDTDDIGLILMTASTAKTVTLPTAADNAGRILTVKKIDSGAGSVTIDGEGAETVDDAANVVIRSQYSYVTVYCDGTEWWIVEMADANTYTPSPTGSNFTSITGGTHHYLRQLNVVTVTGNSVGTVTTTGTDTTLTVAVPIVGSNNFASAEGASGTGILARAGTNIKDACYVVADSGAQTVTVKCEGTTCGSASTAQFFYTFTYTIP